MKDRLACAALTISAAMAVAAGASQPVSKDAESVAAFDKMSMVITSPRCQNCHTLTAYPRQGDDRHAHRFNVMRGPESRGSPGLPCSACHGRANNAVSGVPGADENWRLAPISMGWDGLSKGEICHHLKDPTRNGNRTGAQVIDHLRTHLVMWAWDPGTDAQGRPRTVPPMSYADFIEAAEAWERTGEACPPTS